MEDEPLGERVRRLRKLRGWTQAVLAEKAGMERTDVIKLEKGRLALGPDRLARMAGALGVSVLELQPEAEPDQLGLDLLGRLEALEAAFEKDKQSRERGLRAFVERLADVEAALGLREQPPIRRGRGEPGN